MQILPCDRKAAELARAWGRRQAMIIGKREEAKVLAGVDLNGIKMPEAKHLFDDAINMMTEIGSGNLASLKKLVPVKDEA